MPIYMPASAASSSTPKATKGNFYPPWAPRFWNGMPMGTYFQLLRENKFKIHPTRWPMTALSAFCAVFNSTFAGLQKISYGKTIGATELIQPPIFILGHWRSGTTLLHELMAQDPNLAFPSTYDAFVPEHMLVTRRLFQPVMKFLMPSRRPMDNMSLGASSPQEDDFALLSLNSPTPYRKIAFPRNCKTSYQKLDPQNLDTSELAKLKKDLDYFYRVLTIQYQKRLVLKSPPHTGRIKLLAELFPGAKFVHLSRHPYRLIPSTKKLWKLLYHLQAFQVHNDRNDPIDDYIFNCKETMYDAYFRDRVDLDENQLIEIRFEDLVDEPIGNLTRVYEQLGIEGLEQVIPGAQKYLGRRKGHQTSEYQVDENLQDRIKHGWEDYMTAFEYAAEI